MLQTGSMSVQDYYAGHGLPGIKKKHRKKDDSPGDKVCLTNGPGMVIY